MITQESGRRFSEQIDSKAAGDISPESSPFESAGFPARTQTHDACLCQGEGRVDVGDKAERFAFTLRRVAGNLLSVFIEAPSETARLFSAVGVAACSILRRPAVGAAAAGISLSAFASSSKGTLMTDGSNDAQYLSLGNQATQGQGGLLLSLKVLVPGVGTGERDTSATFLNSQYVITAAHNLNDLMIYNPTIEVGTGNNYLTNPGTLVSVASVTFFPGYVYNGENGPFNTPDLALLRLSQPLPGAAATIAPTTAGETLHAAGFGTAGTPSTGPITPPDGYARGFEAPEVVGVPGNVSPTYYFEGEFSPYTNVPLNGRGASGDSGGPCFDAAGELVGMNVAAWGGQSSIGGTDFLNLTEPDVNNWLSENAVATPEPGTFAIASVACGALLLRRRRH